MRRPIDTGNHQFVSMSSAGDIIIVRPKTVMSREQALTLAAWLVAVAGDDQRFEEILQAVKGT